MEMRLIIGDHHRDLAVSCLSPHLIAILER